MTHFTIQPIKMENQKKLIAHVLEMGYAAGYSGHQKNFILILMRSIVRPNPAPIAAIAG